MFFSLVLVCTAGDLRVDAALGGTAASPSASSSSSGNQLSEPFFAEELRGGRGATVNATAQLGVTTYLHCRVNSLGGKMVSCIFNRNGFFLDH